MRLQTKFLAAVALLAGAGGGAWMSGMAPLSAADHLDPPTRTDGDFTPNPDKAADIADLYLYYTPTSVIVSVDFAGPQANNLPATYDRDVLYTIFLSNAGSRTEPEFTINFRFGQDRNNPAASGVQVTGIPGTTGAVVGPVEQTLTDPSGVKVFAGLIDDPFNFDLVGFRQTRDTGTLSFNNMRNRFTGLNSTAVIIEIPLSAIRNGTNPIAAWTTTARIVAA